VLSTKPFTQSTADWITDKIDVNDKVLFVGYGAIAQKVLSPNAFIVNTKSSKEQLKAFIEQTNCIVVSMTPEGNDNYINDDILKNFKGKIISVSRANVIDNTALLNNLDNITHAYVDTLDSKHREELLESGKVTYTKHTAWEHNFSFEGNPYYYGDLHDILLHCLFDNVKDLDIKPVLDRIDRVTF
jgi:phosphoglycerate dehydrogenase-like enzyme